MCNTKPRRMPTNATSQLLLCCPELRALIRPTINFNCTVSSDSPRPKHSAPQIGQYYTDKKRRKRLRWGTLETANDGVTDGRQTAAIISACSIAMYS